MTHTDYCLTSLDSDDVKYFAKGIRRHWSIDNSLHWVKDIRVNEDNSDIACKVLLLFKLLSLNIYRLNSYVNWKSTTEIFTNKLDKSRLLFRA